MGHTPLVLLTGKIDSFYLPEKLYHGTSSLFCENILSAGLCSSLGLKQSRLSIHAVYLTTSFAMAASIARTRALKLGGDPVVLVVDSSQLNADNMGFDMNMCGNGYTESIAYQSRIDSKAIRISDCNPMDVPSALMLLDAPKPGSRPIAFKADWRRASEFTAGVPVMGSAYSGSIIEIDAHLEMDRDSSPSPGM